MRFKSSKDLFFSTIILATNTLVIAIIIFSLIKGELDRMEYLIMIPLVGVVILLFWMFFGTTYLLTPENFSYQSGPFKDSIALESITEVIKGKTLWVGTRPATARKGLIIKYNKYDEVYISPTTNDTFIEALKTLKSDIKITE